ncbi:hypothetical protein LINPERPRIM_LOCUS4446 [Linum perenne]
MTPHFWYSSNTQNVVLNILRLWIESCQLPIGPHKQVPHGTIRGSQQRSKTHTNIGNQDFRDDKQLSPRSSLPVIQQPPYLVHVSRVSENSRHHELLIRRGLHVHGISHTSLHASLELLREPLVCDIIERFLDHVERGHALVRVPVASSSSRVARLGDDSSWLAIFDDIVYVIDRFVGLLPRIVPQAIYIGHD